MNRVNPRLEYGLQARQEKESPFPFISRAGVAEFNLPGE